MGWSLFRKKKGPKPIGMDFDANKPLEELAKEYEGYDFQWIKGDNIGANVHFKSFSGEGNMKFIEFDDGNRLNVALLNEYVAVFPRAKQDLTKNPVPPPALPPAQNNPQPANNTPTSVNSVSVNRVVSPIYDLLSKQKPNLVDVNISIKINLPPKELYGVLTSSFDNAEKEIVEYVISSLDIEDIKKALSDSILNTYYGGKGKKNEESNKEENKEKAKDEQE